MTRKDELYCKNVIRRNSKSFYMAFRSLPREKRRAVWAIYTFCRQLDDAVDLPGDPDRFEKLASEWKTFTAGTTPDTPLWRELSQVFNRYGAESTPYEGMIAGQRTDMSFRQPETDEELLEYCGLVAGTVGEMLLPVLAIEHRSRLVEAARDLGRAMQLTNILRDAGEDLERGRVYFSRQAMESFGVDREMLKRKAATPQFIALWEHYASMAEALYAKASAALPLFDLDSREPVSRAIRFYRAILNKIREGGYGCLSVRYSLSFRDKLALLSTEERCNT